MQQAVKHKRSFNTFNLQGLVTQFLIQTSAHVMFISTWQQNYIYKNLRNVKMYMFVQLNKQLIVEGI